MLPTGSEAVVEHAGHSCSSSSWSRLQSWDRGVHYHPAEVVAGHRMADAQSLLMSAKVPNDQFLLCSMVNPLIWNVPSRGLTVEPVGVRYLGCD